MTAAVNVFAAIRRETADIPAKPAIIDGDELLTYGDLLAAAQRLADELRLAGVGPCCRVGLLAEDSGDYVVVSLAVLALDAVVVPVAPEQTPDERAAVVAGIGLDVVLAEASLAAAGEPFGQGVLRRAFLLDRPAGAAAPPAGFAGVEPAFIRFSSGTTGASKGVVLSHRAILERTDAADQGLRITRADTVLWVLSMSYHFVVTILLFLRRGATIVLCARRFPEALLDGIVRRRGTFIYASPFHYALLAQSDALDGAALGDVRMAVSTAMQLPEDVAAAFRARFGFELTEAYGIIEVGLPFQRLAGGEQTRGSVGRPLPGFEVQLVEPDAAGVGAIRIRGPGLFDAYYAPWQPRAAVCADGWFATGDLGRLDADGNLFIVGREKAVINFAGMKIFPQEVEAVLNRHPAVQESLVCGVPHPRFGELPVARIVPRGGELVVDELRRYCYRHLTQFKVPKEFVVVDRLEKTASGKLKRG
ncbi:MAG: acyl--CoA ligase [Deltaproteobacteria bacterium]|nr:MAG: acyl--CoA ligase [Deltaproteobacteria bacterium]